MNKKSLLIIALSARPYAVAAKRSGFKVFVIDGFADAETVDAAEEVFISPFDQNGFLASALISIVKKIASQPFLACVFGSGFEAQPALLDQLNALIPVIGNAPQVVRQIKNPQNFFSTLNSFGIATPAIFDATPKNRTSTKYLIKSSGGSGGQHIRYSYENNYLQSGDYCQELLSGESVSVLFLAINSEIKLIGFNAQWVDATASQPFRFGGAASGLHLSQAVKDNLLQIIEKIAQAFGLVGLNSLDVIVQDEKVYVLEVNPRLSATFDLYAQEWLDDFNLDLLALHIQACMNETLQPEEQEKLNAAHSRVMLDSAQHSNAMAIVYANEDVLLQNDFKWPDWTQDRPFMMRLNQSETLENIDSEEKIVKVLANHPVCSVITLKASAKLAEVDVKEKSNWITHQLSKM